MLQQQSAYLSVMESPNINDEITLSQRHVKENESVVLECQATGNPAPTISWKRDDGLTVVANSTGIVNLHIDLFFFF
jgi:hypothetical protein